MRSLLRSGSGLGAILVLASCATGPQFVSMPESWAEKPAADQAFAEAEHHVAGNDRSVLGRSASRIYAIHGF